MNPNLLSLYRSASQDDILTGLSWYPVANEQIREWADHYGRTVGNVAAITAALSPQVSWSRNLVATERLLAGDTVPWGYQTNIRKAQWLADNYSHDLTAVFKFAPKVASFAANLAGDYDVVTVDVHAAQAYLNDPLSNYRYHNARGYLTVANAYVSTAHYLSIAPADFQAIIWLVWKRLHPTNVKRVARQQWAA